MDMQISGVMRREVGDQNLWMCKTRIVNTCCWEYKENKIRKRKNIIYTALINVIIFIQ